MSSNKFGEQSIQIGDFFYFCTYQGAEIDLILETPAGKIAAIEIKFSNTPNISKGFFISCEDLQPDFQYIITPDCETFSRAPSITVCSIQSFLNIELKKL